MKQETFHLMEQLMEATNTARTSKRNMYVFLEDDQWWFCGQVPTTADDFYVAYPNGQIDGAGKAPEITFSDWNEFFERTGEKFKPPSRPEKKPRPEKPRWVSMSTQKKIFIGYCAFAPHFVLMMTTVFSFIFGKGFDFGLLYTCSLFTLPLSLVFVLVSLHRPKHGRTAMLASALALDAHFLFYFHLLYIHIKDIPKDPAFVLTTMISMVFSGVALLLIWDNEQSTSSNMIKEIVEA